MILEKVGHKSKSAVPKPVVLIQVLTAKTHHELRRKYGICAHNVKCNQDNKGYVNNYICSEFFIFKRFFIPFSQKEIIKVKIDAEKEHKYNANPFNKFAVIT